MELKPGYKMTEVGVIPCEWEVPSLGHLTEMMTNGFVGATKPHYAPNENGVLYVQGYNVEENSFNFNGIKFVTKAFHKSHMRSCLQTGDLLTVQTGDVGLTTVVPEFLAGANCHALIISRFNSKRVSSVFISYYLNSKPGRSRLRLIETGTTMKHLNVGDVLDFVVPLPPTKAEQEAIAEALSDADALIDSLEQLLAKKRQIKQGAMQELLTGKKRLPGFIGKWRKTTLGAMVERIVGGGTPSRNISDYWNGSIPWMTVKDFAHYSPFGTLEYITPEGLKCSSSNLIPRRTLITSTRMALGKAVIYEVDVCINQDLKALFISRDCDQEFLYYWFQFNEVRISEMGSGSTVMGIALGELRKLSVALPSLEEQTAIAAVLSDMDAEITSVETKLAKARQIKQGMMQELLTGRIRLVQPSAEVVPFPVKQSVSAATNANHNPQINEAVILAVLAHRFGSEQFPLGRFRRTKLSYLLHRHAERQVAGFMKKAAGPYNPHTRYGGAEKIALKNGYVREHNNGKAEGFIAAENIAQAEGYFENWYGLQVLDWLKQFQYKKNEELELLTTVDMAIEDLRREGKSVTVSAVKQIIHDSPEWKAKLDRATFVDSNITAAIECCRQLFPVEE